MKSIAVAILGATGYTGAELIRILEQHPRFEPVHLGAHSQAGKMAGEVLPGIAGSLSRIVLSQADAPLPDEVELVFTALPHGAAAESVKKILDSGRRVVDLSADFRHKSTGIYKSAYQSDHPCPELLAEAVFGLTEHARNEVAGARLVANPGCYPTSVLLPLIPLLKSGQLETEEIVIDSKSGSSGAGRSAKTELLYCEINEGISAYGLPRHRHAWEMEEWASYYGDCNCSVRFVPHILPMTRGMLSTLHLTGDNPDGWHGILADRYADELFVRILPEGTLPSTQGVKGSNRCDIGMVVTGPKSAVVISCIDNLVKGASGQAIQNANVMFGLQEQLGIPVTALWP